MSNIHYREQREWLGINKIGEKVRSYIEGNCWLEYALKIIVDGYRKKGTVVRHSR